MRRNPKRRPVPFRRPNLSTIDEITEPSSSSCRNIQTRSSSHERPMTPFYNDSISSRGSTDLFLENYEEENFPSSSSRRGDKDSISIKESPSWQHIPKSLENNRNNGCKHPTRKRCSCRSNDHFREFPRNSCRQKNNSNKNIGRKNSRSDSQTSRPTRSSSSTPKPQVIHVQSRDNMRTTSKLKANFSIEYETSQPYVQSCPNNSCSSMPIVD